MHINDYGWEEYKKQEKSLRNNPEDSIARVAVENKTNYLLYSNFGELEGVVRGKVLASGPGAHEIPKIGDWVRIQKLPNENKAVIEAVLPRLTTISRAGANKKPTQIIAVNVDIIFIIQALDDDFSLRRLERYIIMTRMSGCRPIIILTKSDLISNPEEKAKEVKDIAPNIPVFAISTLSGKGLEHISSELHAGQTIVLVGSSGAGKSTLINYLFGSDIQKTAQVRLSDSKGRHTTTRRELILLPNKSLLIDTPGMRELGIEASAEEIGDSFSDIELLAKSCKFFDCDHVHSKGCAVLEAVKSNTLARDRYRSYLKLIKEIKVQSSKETRFEKTKRKQNNKKIQRKLNKDLRNNY